MKRMRLFPYTNHHQYQTDTWWELAESVDDVSQTISLSIQGIQSLMDWLNSEASNDP